MIAYDIALNDIYKEQTDVIDTTKSKWHENKVTVLEYDQNADKYIPEKWISHDNDPVAELDRITEIKTYYEEQRQKVIEQNRQQQYQKLDSNQRPPTKFRQLFQSIQRTLTQIFVTLSNSFL